MSNENLLDLCRLNLMEENVKNSPAPDKSITMKAIDRKKRELVMKIKPAAIAPDVMERHIKANTVDGVYPWIEAEKFRVYKEATI